MDVSAAKKIVRRALRKTKAGRSARRLALSSGRVERVPPGLSYRGPELKEILSSLSAENMVSTNTLLLNGIAEGSDKNNRIGRRIHFKSLEYVVEANPSTTTTLPNHFIWAIVYDRSPNASQPGFSSIFDTTNGNSDPTLAFRTTFDRESRYVLLKVEQCIVGPVSGMGGYCKRGYLNLPICLKESDSGTSYTGTGATIASISVGGLYFVYGVSNQVTFADAANFAKITCGFKLKFTDT